MRKTLLFLSVLLLALCSVPAAAQDESSGYYYDPESPLLGDPEQINSNSVFMAECSPVGTVEDAFMALIDNNTATYFQSYWKRALFTSATLTEDEYIAALSSLSETDAMTNGTGYHNLQVTLYDPVQAFFFTYTARNSAKYCDFPTDVVIYATNDDALGASTLASESSKWTKITEITEGFPAAVAALAKYASPAIDMGTAYKYIRFEIRNTITSDDGGTGLRPTSRPELTGRVFDLAEFQIYEGKKIEGYRSRLDSLVNAITASDYNFPSGDDPGYVPASKVEAFENAYQNALEKYVLDLTDAECKEIYDGLYSALSAVLNSETNPLEDGYYNIVSVWNVFRNNQGVDKAWYYDGDKGGLYWTTYNNTLPAQLFKLEKQPDGKYSVQNVLSKKYLSHVTKNGVAVPFTDTYESGQVFQPFDAKPYEFKIYSPDFDSKYNKYNTRQHSNGTAVTGMVATWDSDVDGEAAWYLKRVSGDLLDSLLRVADTDAIAEDMRVAINTGQAQYDKCYEYNSIFNDAAQMTTNSQNPSDGSIAALLDNNTGTYFHSAWEAAFKSVMTTGGTGYHNMQFALEEPVSSVKFYYAGRINSSGWVDDPDHITIYATNNEELAASVAAADSLYWDMILDMEKPAYDFPKKNNNGSTFTSPVIELGGNYKYIRFVVKHTNGQGTMSSRTFYDPSVSGVTFELSEFRLWNGAPADDSEALHIEGMTDACNTLSALLKTSREKLAAGTATDADIQALKDATEAVAKLYVDRDSIDDALADALKAANAVYNEQTGSKVNILTSVGQLSTNNASFGDSGASSLEGSLAHLIDNDVSTCFHSFWNRSYFSGSNVTEEGYLNLAASTSNIYVNGAGYHNLQVALPTARSSFYFTMTGRSGTTYHDIPTDIAIYATNDDDLGTSTLDSETSQWTEITELTENMPANIEAVYWESPLIDMGQDYKYVRFVVKNVTRIADRPTTNPSITGIVYNLSEFHMYGGSDPATLPYTYDSELKAAVDALGELITQYSEIEKHTLYTTEPIVKLAEAIAKVNSLIVDTTELVTLYNNYVERIGNSVVGQGIGYVDNAESLEAFATAITKARAIASTPTKSTVSTAISTMKTAYAEFLSHVGQITPNKWYNISSASTREAFVGQPLHLSPTTRGTELCIGDFDVDNADPSEDPYSIWQFIPVEGTEYYYIQNLGTGQYIGSYVNNTTSMKMQHEPVAYRLIYFGDGGFRITQAANDDDKLAFKTDTSLKGILTYPLNSDNQQVFMFDEVQAGEAMVLSDFKNNSIQIVTLPYATSISELNSGKAETYAVKSISTDENGSTLELTKISATEAGVPFILVCGDYTQSQSDETVALSLTIPEEIVDEGTEGNNGLVGTLSGVSVTQEGLGMFIANKLYSTTKMATTFNAMSGYINPGKVKSAAGDADLVISSKDIINGIENAQVAADKNGKVNVYTIEGTLVKKNVDAASAKSGLVKGVYIIGGKKALVK